MLITHEECLSQVMQACGQQAQTLKFQTGAMISMESCVEAKRLQHTKEVMQFSFFRDNTNWLWALGFSLRLSHHGLDPHLPALFPQCPGTLVMYGRLPLGMFVINTILRRTPVLPDWGGSGGEPYTEHFSLSFWSLQKCNIT